MTEAIGFESLSLGYGDKVLLKAFSAQIQAGEFIGVFGPNGAGKSTLLRALLGLIPISSGHVKILGKKVKRGALEIGYLPQSRASLNVNLSGRSVLYALYQGERLGLPWLNRGEKQAVDEAIALVGAAHYADRPIATLSGG